jgi:hypothetical protein
VQWLENRGSLEFILHDIDRFYGAYSVAAGDIDGDEDLDVVAGSFLTDLRDPRRYSLVTLELSDLDSNGSLDLIAGGLMMPAYANTPGRFPFNAQLSVWRNQ